MPPNHAERVINKFQQHQVASHLTSAGRQDSDRQKVLCCFRDPHRSPAPVEHAVARGACSSCGIPQPHSPLPSPCSCQTLRCTRATYLFTLTKIVHYCRRWFKTFHRALGLVDSCIEFTFVQLGLQAASSHFFCCLQS